MSQEIILILCGIGIFFFVIIFLSLWLRRISRTVDKIDAALSVMMQTDEKNTKKVISTVEQVVANSISDLRATHDVVEKYDENGLYKNMAELFNVSNEFYTTDHLQRIFRAEYMGIMRVLYQLKDDGLITQIKDEKLNAYIWVSSDCCGEGGGKNPNDEEDEI